MIEALPTRSTQTDTIHAKLEEIADFLVEFKDYKRATSLMGGDFGVAIFLAQYGRFKGNDRYSNKANQLIEKAYDVLANQYTAGSFCNGLAGLGWGLNYLIKEKLVEGDLTVIDEGLAPLIAASSIRLLKQGEYDYLHMGGSGFLYFLEQPDSANKRTYLEEAVELLYKTAKKENGSIKWQHDPNSRLERTQDLGVSYNLGLSHGIPSLLSLLSRVNAQGIAQEKCEEMVMGMMQWMQSTLLPLDANSLYPSSERLNVPNTASRLGWCYGDLGIARTLFTAGKAFNNQDWIDLATKTYSHAANRRDINKNIVRDAGICHGSAGISHMFYDAWTLIGHTEFLDASNYWLDITLEYANRPEGYCGYQAARDDFFENSTSFLDGISGIGLALLNRLDPGHAGWDRMLLMS